MRPVDFVVFDGDSSPNLPALTLAEALMAELVVRGCDGEYEVLSYYYSEQDGKMVLDIQKLDGAL